jgi:hypothetical protein
MNAMTLFANISKNHPNIPTGYINAQSYGSLKPPTYFKINDFTWAF